jgi:hypothetical protein
MGYTTEFKGQFELSKEASNDIVLELEKWWDNEGDNQPIRGYCQWVLNEQATVLSWDGNEKFYDYVEWLKAIISLFEKEDIVLNGEVFYSGEIRDDVGSIKVDNNKVEVK